MRVLLVGNPNSGKTTLFNALTGEHQQVGNWPGVTVEKKTGSFKVGELHIELVDLPGLYSLASSTHAGLDEQITAKAIASLDFDCIINVIDACALERHLYLTSQLLELERPMLIAINMMDLAQAQGISIQTTALSEALHCPVISLEAHRGVGVKFLQEQLAHAFEATVPLKLPCSFELKQALEHISAQLQQQGSTRALSYFTYRVAEGDCLIAEEVALPSCSEPLDLLLADARYTAVNRLVRTVQTRVSDAKNRWTEKIDRVVLHRFFALPIFFTLMYILFFLAIHVGGALQGAFDVTTQELFVILPSRVLAHFHCPEPLIAWIAHGVGRGLATTLTFIPVMACMYFFLSLLEASGYMARAAFIMDRVMRLLGLPGKAFVPLMVGFGCNVPAIMATRTLENERDRFITILMTPFMSCSARLAIYAVFVAAFFPEGGQNIVFSLYLIGIAMALLTGFMLRHTLFKGEHTPLIIELPVYHRPVLRRLFRETAFRLKAFVWRAGQLIIPICALLGALATYSFQGHLVAEQDSILAWVGQHLTFIFTPMGLTSDNWPATVGLMTGVLAKEVVIGTLNGLYANLAGDHASVYGVMMHAFHGPVGAYAYLLFILLYIPCVSTIAVIRSETHRRLMWFSVGWSTFVAYMTATLFYQLATVFEHPAQTLEWVMWVAVFVVMSQRWVRHRFSLNGAPHVVTAS
jgi:ferrous iron transport protein B